jgi:hypothetical protein
MDIPMFTMTRRERLILELETELEHIKDIMAEAPDSQIPTYLVARTNVLGALATLIAGEDR